MRIKRYTVDEYLVLERASQTRHEFLGGEIFEILAESADHSSIGINLGSELRERLRDTAFRVYQCNMRVRCPAGLWTYPDVSLGCGSAEFTDEHHDTLLNPWVIVEVLSRASERHDRGAKFSNYRSIPMLRECALVHQDRMRVEHYVRQEGAGAWLLKSITDPAASIHFPSLGCEVPLAEIYLNVTLPQQGLSLHAGDDAATL